MNNPCYLRTVDVSGFFFFFFLCEIVRMMASAWLALNRTFFFSVFWDLLTFLSLQFYHLIIVTSDKTQGDIYISWYISESEWIWCWVCEMWLLLLFFSSSLWKRGRVSSYFASLLAITLSDVQVFFLSWSINRDQWLYGFIVMEFWTIFYTTEIAAKFFSFFFFHYKVVCCVTEWF